MLEPPAPTEVFIPSRPVPPGVYGERTPPVDRVVDVLGTTDAAALLAMTDWSAARHSPLLMTVLVLAGIGTTLLFLLGVVAYRRRRTRPYLLITLALAALVVRTVVGLGTVYGHVPMGLHHLVEHGLDFLIAVFLLTAVYLSGPRSSGEEFG